jgi:hypothetical protein
LQKPIFLCYIYILFIKICFFYKKGEAMKKEWLVVFIVVMSTTAQGSEGGKKQVRRFSKSISNPRVPGLQKKVDSSSFTYVSPDILQISPRAQQEKLSPEISRVQRTASQQNMALDPVVDNK